MTDSMFVKALPSSFVASNMKIATDRGAGEAKLWVGQMSNAKTLDSFFQFDNGYTYSFDKQNLLDYLNQVKIEYVYQRFNHYKNATLAIWNENYTNISNLTEKEMVIHLARFTDDSRYYIRSDSDLFRKQFRKMALPKLTNVHFLKDESKKHILITLELNLNYDKETEGAVGEEDFYSRLEEKRVEGGTNVLLYGVPGAGKSWTIQKEYCDDENHIERVVFHPDYTYSDFVGQILPRVEDDQVTYEFTPGPFTTLLKDAYENPDQEFFLIIEEINRGNAPAIFGEVFQLLDRKVEMTSGDDGYPIGTSEYGITNTDIAREVYGDPKHKVRIPSNMSIIGTMNTSDQNVFTLDTAFQRRWEMRLIENSFENVDERFKSHPILDTSVTWEVFCKGINSIILEKNVRNASSEDKRLGTYYVRLRDLIYDNTPLTDEMDSIERAKIIRNNRRFPEKVLKYLWDDAFKFSREDVFDVARFNSLESVINYFMSETGNDRFSIFTQTVLDILSINSSHVE